MLSNTSSLVARAKAGRDVEKLLKGSSAAPGSRYGSSRSIRTNVSNVVKASSSPIACKEAVQDRSAALLSSSGLSKVCCFCFFLRRLVLRRCVLCVLVICRGRYFHAHCSCCGCEKRSREFGTMLLSFLACVSVFESCNLTPFVMCCMYNVFLVA